MQTRSHCTMRTFLILLLQILLLAPPAFAQTGPIDGFSAERALAQRRWEEVFRAVPSPKSAREHLRLLTLEPEFRFRGLNVDQLKNLSIEALLPLLNARQRRSLDKRVGKYMNDEKRKLRERIKNVREGNSNETIRTHVRDMIILPDMVGITINIHNGKDFSPIAIKPEMIGHYLGEYSITNKRVQHGAPGVGASRSSLYVPLK